MADAYAGLGWAYMAADRVGEAEAGFRKALELIPGYVSAQTGLGTIQYRKTAFVAEGWEPYFKGEYEAALAAFEAKREAAKAEGNPTAEDGRGWALLALVRGKEAARAFDAALEIDPDFFYSRSGRIATQRLSLNLYNQAWSWANAGEFDRAEDLFARARAETSEEFQWLIDDGLAWLDYYRKNYDKAEAAFEAILDRNPDAYLSRKGLGFVTMARKDFDAMVKHVTASLVQNPYQVLTSYTVPATALLEAADYQKAKGILELGARSYPLSADLQFMLARTFGGLNDDDRSALHAVAAARLAPAYIDPAFDELGLDAARVRDGYLALAWGLYFAGNNEGAIARFNQYIDAGGDDPNAVRGRGFALFRLARYDETLPDLKASIFEEASRLMPITESIAIPGTGQRWPVIYNARSTLGWVYYRIDQPKRAEVEFRALLKDNPFWVDALTGLGYAQLAQNNRKGAIESFRRALDLSAYYPDARRGLAEAEQPP